MPDNISNSDRILFYKILALLKDKGVVSFPVSITAVGIIAGTLSASNIIMPLWFYLLLYPLFYIITLLLLGLKEPRYRYFLPALLLRGDVEEDRVGGKSIGLVVGTASQPVAAVAAGGEYDVFYNGGMRTIINNAPTKIVIASNPRDIAQRHRLVFPLYKDNYHGGLYEIKREAGGSPRSVTFKRALGHGYQEKDHMLPSRDLSALSALGQSFNSGEGLDVVPEHCLQLSDMHDNNLIIIGGGDSNFWHPYFFELLYQQYKQSTIPLAVDLREEGEVGRYGSEGISVQLHGFAETLGLPEHAAVVLDERNHPVYGMILLAANPLNEKHWCCFVAGVRSLGTAGAAWALSRMVHSLQEDNSVNFFSYTQTREKRSLPEFLHGCAGLTE